MFAAHARPKAEFVFSFGIHGSGEDIGKMKKSVARLSPFFAYAAENSFMTFERRKTEIPLLNEIIAAAKGDFSKRQWLLDTISESYGDTSGFHNEQMNFVVYNKLKYFPLEAYNENFSESFREKMLLLQCEVTMLAMKGDLEAAKGKLLEEMQTFTANSTRRDEGMVKNMKTYASDLVSHLRLRNTPKPLRVLVRLGYLHTNAYIQAQKAYKDNPDISITRVFDDKVTQYGVYDWIERALQHGKEIKDDWLQFGVLMEVLQQSSKITGKGDKFMIQLSKGKDLTAGEIGRLLADNAYKGQDLVQWADAVYDSTIDLIARKEKQQ